MYRDHQMSVSVCVFLFAYVLVHCSIKKSHCVTAARLVPSCFRGEGKTGRIRGGMSIGRGRASLKLHTSIKGNGSMLVRLSYAHERLKSCRHIAFAENVCGNNGLPLPMKQVGFKNNSLKPMCYLLDFDAGGM